MILKLFLKNLIIILQVLPVKLKKKKIPKTRKNFKDYLDQPTLDSFFINPTTEEEVKSIIEKLKNRKAIGPFSINTKILKICKNELSRPLSQLFNKSFQMGIFPSQCKLANVIPIFKNGNKAELNNYRPISLLSNISKIIERLMYNRLYLFLEQKNILYDLQFGFRYKHSTEHALISITEKIREACDSGNFACGVFIDLRKAFDTVNHDILLHKLNHVGIRGITNQWFSSYLKNREQFVSIQGNKSKNNIITHGVPQGSILGPLLFIIFINDLNKAIKHSTVHHFADDTNLLLADRSIKRINKRINHDLRLLTEWLRANKISLNADKTEIIIFKSKSKHITKHLNFRIDGKKIIPKTSVKYLGLYLQDDLHWNTHLNLLIKKLSRSVGILSKVRHFVPHWLLRTIYYSLFNSHLIYGCQIWGQKNSTLLDKIKKIQEKALKVIHFDPTNVTTNTLFSNSKILKLTDFIKYRNICYIRDSLKKNNPKPFHGIFTIFNEIHQYHTRGANKNLVNMFQSQTSHYGQSSIKSRSVNNWNFYQQNLEIDLLNVEYSQFKSELLKAIYINYQ